MFTHYLLLNPSVPSKPLLHNKFPSVYFIEENDLPHCSVQRKLRVSDILSEYICSCGHDKFRISRPFGSCEIGKAVAHVGQGQENGKLSSRV